MSGYMNRIMGECRLLLRDWDRRCIKNCCWRFGGKGYIMNLIKNW